MVEGQTGSPCSYLSPKAPPPVHSLKQSLAYINISCLPSAVAISYHDRGLSQPHKKNPQLTGALSCF